MVPQELDKTYFGRKDMHILLDKLQSHGMMKSLIIISINQDLNQEQVILLKLFGLVPSKLDLDSQLLVVKHML